MTSSEIRAQDIMTKEVVTGRPDETVVAAAQRMREGSVECLILAVDQVVRGIITDRDILGCIVAGHDPQQCALNQHMSRPVTTVAPNELLLNVAQRTVERKIKRVPVVSDDRLVGILSFVDITRALDNQVQHMWSEWVQLTRLVQASGRHQRGA